MSWVTKYLSIPFSNVGCEFDGCNCWGLIKLMYETEKGIRLIAYHGTSAADVSETNKSIEQDGASPPWQNIIDIGKERAFDVVVMRGILTLDGKSISVPVHIGIIITPGIVMHIQEGSNISCVPITHPSVRRRIISIHRHELLM